MLQPLRLALAVLALAALTGLARPEAARAQVDYETIATEADLTASGTIGAVNIVGLRARSTGTLVFFNDAEDNIVEYDPADGSVTLLRTAADLDADFGGTDITACDGAAVDANDDLYFILRDGATNTNRVYKLAADGTPTVLADDANGANAITVSGSTVYLGLVEFFDAAEDGVSTLDTSTANQTATVVFQNADLDIADLAIDGTDLLIVSSEFGGGSFENVVALADLTASPVTASVYAEPFADGIFTNGSDGGMEGIEVAGVGGRRQVYLFNNSFGGNDGEEFGFYVDAGSGAQGAFQFATEAALAADPDVNAGAIGGGGGNSLAVLPGGSVDLAFASRDNFGDPNEIIALRNAPIPVELTAFDAVTQPGGAVRLTWATATETNNAGFEVQQRAAGAFRPVGFVEGAGTTDAAQAYGFTVEGLAPGTYAFRLRQVDFDGGAELSPTVEVTVTPEGRFALTPVAPTPVVAGRRAETTLAVDQAQRVRVTLYNALGQRVRTLFDARVRPEQPATLTLRTDGLTSGVYFVRAEGTTARQTRRLTVVR